MGGNGRFMSAGWRYILPVWGVTLFVLIFSDAVFINLLLITVSFLVAYLFYVPERNSNEISKSAVLSPVDGTVLSIKEGEESLYIKISKSIFDGSSAVYSPVNGDLVEKRRIRGLFVGKEKKLAERLNEHVAMRWKIGEDEAVMKLFCGFYSMGVLVFDSKKEGCDARVIAHLSDGIAELVLPKSVEVEVSVGDRVLGGYSLLGYGRE